MGLIKINGTDIPAGATLEISTYDLDGNAERNAAGRMIRDRIAIKHGVTISYTVISQEELSGFLSMISPVTVNITYMDPLDDIVTRTMYVGDRKASLIRWDDRQKVWRDISYEFVEV